MPEAREQVQKVRNCASGTDRDEKFVGNGLDREITRRCGPPKSRRISVGGEVFCFDFAFHT
jgi:hypothetical protein